MNMSKELINYSNELSAMDTIADYASKTKWFEALGGKPGMTMIALYARELGLPVMQCLFGGMKPVLGKIEISPVMMVGLIRKAGHKLEINTSSTVCKMKGIRKDTGETYECSFSIEDAKKANIYKNAWITYPEDMCFNRCAGRMSRRLFSDVLGPSYAEGEINVEEDWNHKNEDSLSIKPVDEKVVEVTIEETQEKKIAGERIYEFHSLTRDYPEYQEKVRKKYPVLADMTERQYDSVMKHFENWKANQKNKKTEPEQETVEQQEVVAEQIAMPF
jgi:hypothetical protein